MLSVVHATSNGCVEDSLFNSVLSQRIAMKRPQVASTHSEKIVKD